MSKPTSSTPSLDDIVDHKGDPDTKHDPRREPDLERGSQDEKQNDGDSAAPEVISPFHPSQFPDGGKDAMLCLLGVSITPRTTDSATKLTHRPTDLLLPLL